MSVARSWVMILSSICLLMTLGCGSGRTKMSRAQAMGRVLCEGRPVPHVMVYFMPKAEGKNGNVGKFGMGPTDQEGNFSIATYDSNDGAVIGKHIVRVAGPLRDAPAEFKCDCILSEEYDVTEVEVVSGKNNLFEIQLMKATKQDQLAVAKRKAALEAEDD